MFLNNKKLTFDERGVALLLALVIMGVIFGIAFGFSALLIKEIKFSIEIADSTIAFFAADTGIERILYDIRKAGYVPLKGDVPFSDVGLPNHSSYTVEIRDVSPDVYIASEGLFRGVKRVIEIHY